MTSEPLYVESTCAKCGELIVRYRWETKDSAWIHPTTTRKNTCLRQTRAKAVKPGEAHP